MSLFIGPMRQHIPGHKDLSEDKTVLELKAGKQVFIPLYASHSANFELLVKEGDHVCVGSKIAQCNERMIVPIYASVSGNVVGVQKVMHSTLKPIDHLVIENDGKMEEVASFDTIDYQTASREDLIEFMKEAGIVGQGGAGFPAYVKYQFAKDVKKLIINAVECEPFITADYRMMSDHLQELLVGVLAMKKMAQAEEALIAIKKSHPELIKQMQEAIANVSGVRVVSVPDVYPMGWERVLVRQLMKKEYDKLPSEVGAVVNNATTAIAFAQAMQKGRAIVDSTFTVSGDGVKNPVNVRCPIGVPVSEIIEACGGYTAEDVKLIAGGPMMGKTIVNDKFVMDRAMNAITVLITKPYESIACLRCGKCSDVCPAGLQPVRIAQAVNTNDKDTMNKMCALDCIECGLCTYVCPSRLDVTENVRKAKRTLALAKK